MVDEPAGGRQRLGGKRKERMEADESRDHAALASQRGEGVEAPGDELVVARRRDQRVGIAIGRGRVRSAERRSQRLGDRPLESGTSIRRGPSSAKKATGSPPS